MDAQMEYGVALIACTPCKHHKRKCNKALPACGTCIRVGRECLYEPASNQVNLILGSSSVPIEPPDQYQTALSLPSSTDIDPFQFPTLRDATLDLFITRQASTVLGDVQQMGNTATRYFAGIYLRVPIVSRKQFLGQVSTLYSHPRASFTLLCLSIHLLIRRPDEVESAGHHAQTMHSSTYVMAKSFIGVIQSLTTPTLELIQAMVLIVLYETGHGMYPAASMSIAACARAARSIGLNRRPAEMGVDDQVSLELRKRLWWAIFVLDRFINLCTGDKIFAADDPQPTDTLPMELEAWETDAYAEARDINLSTPSDIRVGPFARECQVSHLIGRVVRHVFDPAADATFQKEEAVQLEQTLNAFLPLLMEQETHFGLFCAALGLCSSGLFTIYDAALSSAQYAEDEQRAILQSLESSSTRIALFSRHLFGDPSQRNIGVMSPFVPYSLYQAAVVQHRLARRTGETDYQRNFNSLKTILGTFKQRWLIAGKYLDALETHEAGTPAVMFFTHGAPMSERRI